MGKGKRWHGGFTRPVYLFCQTFLVSCFTLDEHEMWFSLCFRWREIVYLGSPKNSQKSFRTRAGGNEEARLRAIFCTHASHLQRVRNGIGRALSKLGFTNLIFVEPGAKINRQHYWDVFLMHELLPAISSRGASRIWEEGIRHTVWGTKLI